MRQTLNLKHIINTMLWCICLVIDHRSCPNVVKTKWHTSAAKSVAHVDKFNIFCDFFADIEHRHYLFYFIKVSILSVHLSATRSKEQKYMLNSAYPIISVCFTEFVSA